MIRKTLAMSLTAAVLTVCGCGPTQSTKSLATTPDVLNFSILSAENQQSMGPLWQPLIDDLQKQTGLKVKPFFASNYTALVEAMRFNQVQVGWFSAVPAIDAIDRANAHVLGRIISNDGSGGYESVLIVRKGSGITLDDVLKCGKRYDFGMGDPRSTSGTLAPAYYLFTPRGITPAECFKTVRSASHQANLGAVANGVVDVASNNTEGLLFASREATGKDIVTKVQTIWTSPPLPESAILARGDLDPAVTKKLRDFFIHYGKAPGAEGDRERKVMAGLTYQGFAPADDGYLDSVRAMIDSNALADARKSGDPARIAAAQKVFDVVQARLGPNAPSATTIKP
ncbi:MAG TPA: phosphate/phosphite/phosphonate ABC transporter substrate-binding protein [Caulobacteraceae bacterium]|jgi:phosphonate transport system substrate-binding protein|nr:phosphate/phosphite/phosphonate ABC transporter substrate-binding protein [Caulobacteraceae bacterium]